MLKIIQNRLKPHAEKIIAEEQAGFRAGRSTTEQIFNLHILCEKYLQHQQDLYHVLACSFLGNHEEVQHQHKPYPIIKNLYNKATSAVLLTAAWETGSGQQLKSDRDVYSHPPSSTYFWKRS